MENKVYYGEYTLRHWINLILKKNIVLPKYQRHFVWDDDKIKNLIESLKRKKFVPPVTIGVIKENKESSNLILDGQQRLTSILLAFLNVFPDKEKFKSRNITNYADENDDRNDDENDDENDNRLEWTFEKIVTLSKEERANIKTNTEFYQPLKINTDIDDSFWDTNFLGFAYIVPHTKDKGEQQKFYSSVFKNINTQGAPLSVEESRKSLYFLKEGFENFFETDAVRGLKVRQPTKPKDVDFIKYLSLLSQYKKDGRANRLAFGYSGTKKSYGTMEKYYENYIYSVVGEDTSNLFADFTTIFPDNDYQSRFTNLKNTINDLIDNKEFPSIIDLDMHLFGLVYKIVFENKRIDLSRKTDLVNELNTKIRELKTNNAHTKSPSNLNHLKKRVESSIEIYNKYEEA